MSLEVETESMQSGNLGLKIILTEAKSILIALIFIVARWQPCNLAHYQLY